jgi:O-methyltransferase
MSITHPLLSQHQLLSEQVEEDELSTILYELEGVLKLGLNGHVCEFGCFIGTTSLFLQRILITFNSKTNSKKKLYLYDSFDGLPEKVYQDQSAAGVDFTQGELYASKSQLKLNFKKANLPVPKIKKAWFSNLKPKDIPNEVCFVFLDGDFYSSIWDSLKLIKNSVVESGIIIIDDYENPALPGTKTAVSEFLQANKNFKLRKITHSLAILKKGLAD